jgi:uncharacterized protein
MANLTDEQFLGTGWRFPPEFPESGRNVAMVSHHENVRQALQILLRTAKFSRLMHPEFYCDLQTYVFGSINSQTISRIKTSICDAILSNEHRVDVTPADIDIAEDVTDQHQPLEKLIINVHYTVRSTNSRQNIVFPFYLQEGTNITEFTQGQG